MMGWLLRSSNLFWVADICSSNNNFPNIIGTRQCRVPTILKMPFHRKSTDDWPCFVSVLFLVRSSHVHQYSQLGRLCQYFLQKFFFESDAGAIDRGITFALQGFSRSPAPTFTRNILFQFHQPVQNQSIDFLWPLVVGTMARVRN